MPEQDSTLYNVLAPYDQELPRNKFPESPIDDAPSGKVYILMKRDSSSSKIQVVRYLTRLVHEEKQAGNVIEYLNQQGFDAITSTRAPEEKDSATPVFNLDAYFEQKGLIWDE